MSVVHVQSNAQIILYLGQIEILPSISINANDFDMEKSVEQLVVEQVENALLADTTLNASTEFQCVIVHVSERGLKIVDKATQKVIDRVALHAVVKIASYDDGSGHFNVVLLLQPVHGAQICHVFQSATSDLADMLCNKIKNAFEIVESTP